MISVKYIYDNKSKLYDVKLDYHGEEPCQTTDCTSMLQGLNECSTKSINVSHPSCEPPKILELHVPPGKYKFISTSISESVQFHVCVLVVQKLLREECVWRVSSWVTVLLSLTSKSYEAT
jgi:hypothetical protein